MPKASNKPANHLRAWREFHEMSQDELGAKVGTNGSVISLLESGGRGLSLKWLLKLAPALKTSPGFLLDHDPNNLDTRILEIVAAANEVQKRQIVDIAKTIIGSGTNG